MGARPERKYMESNRLTRKAQRKQNMVSSESYLRTTFPSAETLLSSSPI